MPMKRDVNISDIMWQSKQYGKDLCPDYVKYISENDISFNGRG